MDLYELQEFLLSSNQYPSLFYIDDLQLRIRLQLLNGDELYQLTIIHLLQDLNHPEKLENHYIEPNQE
jgi:hypothetical protein